MATANPPSPTTTEPSDNECSVCNELFTVPKLLPCGHVLCRHCLVTWLQSQPQAHCPLCRRPVVEPVKAAVASNDWDEMYYSQNDVSVMQSCEQAVTPKLWDVVADGFPTDLAMVELVEAERLLSKDHQCCFCDDAKATFLCLDCHDLYCASCKNGHIKQKMSRHHSVQDLIFMTADQLASRRPSPCPAHADKACELYCPSHDASMCTVCFASRHRSCPDVTDLQHKADESRAVLQQLATKLAEAEKKLDQGLSELDELLHDKMKKSKASLAELKAACNRLKSALDAYYIRLEQEVEEDRSDVSKKVNDDKACLLQQRRRVTSEGGVMDRVLGMKKSDAIITMASVMEKRIEDLDLGVALPDSIRVVKHKSLVVDKGIEKKMLQQLPSLGTFATTSSKSIPPPQPQPVAPRDDFINNFNQMTIGQDGCGGGVEWRDQMLMYEFSETVMMLTTGPGNYTEYLKPLCEKIKLCQSSEVYSSIIRCLYEQCIYEPNFRYTGARSLQFLCRELQGHQIFGNFKRDFLNKCQGDFERREQLIGSGTNGELNICGLALFMGELYMNVRDDAIATGKSEQLTFLPGALTDLLLTLVNHPSDVSIKAACLLLKLAGGPTEDAMSKKDPAKFNSVFKFLAVLKDNFKLMSKNSQCLIKSVLVQRRNNWGRSDPAEESDDEQYSAASSLLGFSQRSFEPLEPVFYNKYGKPVTREKAGFNQEKDDDEEYFGGFVLTDEEKTDYLEWLEELQLMDLASPASPVSLRQEVANPHHRRGNAQSTNFIRWDAPVFYPKGSTDNSSTYGDYRDYLEFDEEYYDDQYYSSESSD